MRYIGLHPIASTMGTDFGLSVGKAGNAMREIAERAVGRPALSHWGRSGSGVYVRAADDGRRGCAAVCRAEVTPRGARGGLGVPAGA
jgi:hypothetical protein